MQHLWDNTNEHNLVSSDMKFQKEKRKNRANNIFEVQSYTK